MKESTRVHSSEIPEFLTINELQKVIRLSRPSLNKLLTVKGFPYIKIGSKVLVPKADLIQWLNENKNNNIKL